MSCPNCDGIGYIYQRKDYKSRYTGELYPGTTVAIRCPLYDEYFQECAREPLAVKPIYNDQLCSAASKRHERIRDEATGKDKDKRRGM